MTPFMEEVRLACGRAFDRGLREPTVVYMGRETRNRMVIEALNHVVIPRNEYDRDEIGGFKIYVVDAEEYLEVG